MRVLRHAGVVVLLAAVVTLPGVGPTGARSVQAELPVGWSKGSSLPAGFDPRWDFAYGYFPPDDEVVLFGGAPRKISGDTWRKDTWIYNGSSWSQGPSAPAGLTPRGGATMAYHPGIGKLVMFGGAGPAWPPYRETWLWNGDQWSRGPDGPPAMAGRTGAQMAYHSGINKLVLFGGSGVFPYRDTWLFNGTSWTAGPSSPQAMTSRTFFGMAYDPKLGKIVIAGGNGLRDVWYFGGTSWTQGPPMAAGERERLRMDYDPDLGGIVAYGGIGPGVAHVDAWLLRDGAWTEILQWSGHDWPSQNRVDGAVLWHPTKDALMMFSGILGENGGISGLRDTWFFREVAPKVQSVTLTPSGPQINQAIMLDKGNVQDGYRNWYYEYQWFKNGVLLPGNTDTKLEPAEGDYDSGDTILAKVRVYDHLGIYGPWVSSNTVTIINRAPQINRVTMSPTKAYVSSTLTANPFGMSDSDGDSYTVHYQWKVDGAVVSNNDKQTLSPDKHAEGDSVVVSAWVVDEHGKGSPTVVSSAKTINWNVNPVSGSPGNSRTVKGFGFAPNEWVDVRLDSVTGTITFSIKADGAGEWTKTGWIVPDLPGSSHTLWGVGRTSGTQGPGPLTISHLAPDHPGPA